MLLCIEWTPLPRHVIVKHLTSYLSVEAKIVLQLLAYSCTSSVCTRHWCNYASNNNLILQVMADDISGPTAVHIRDVTPRSILIFSAVFTAECSSPGIFT